MAWKSCLTRSVRVPSTPAANNPEFRSGRMGPDNKKPAIGRFFLFTETCDQTLMSSSLPLPGGTGAEATD